MSQQPVEIFISYAHEDKKVRQKLEKHLQALHRQGFVSIWTDSAIQPGDRWRKVLEDKLNSARVFILLVSADFIASDFCYTEELSRALERHEKGDACVIPVILRPCDWNYTLFAKLQVLPSGGKPVCDWKTYDAAFTDVAAGIRQVITKLKQL